MALLLAVEGGSLLLGRALVNRGIFYSPVLSDHERYTRRRDAVLGWPPPAAFGGGSFDAAGARPSPAFPDPTSRPLVSLYGDSFTYAFNVSHEHAWGNLLARRVGRRVHNFGVGGYGTDQALLRFERNLKDDAPVALIGHVSENILRNLNQFRDLLYPGKGDGFTPRFALEGERLRLIPLAALPSRERYVQAVLHPEEVFTHDPFVPGGAAGVGRLSFPYTLSVLRAWDHFHLRAWRNGEPWYMDHYRDGHPARGTDLTAAILRRFQSSARKRGKDAVALVIPTGLDLTYYRERGRWPYQPLLEKLRVQGTRHYHMGPALLEHMGDRELRTFFHRQRIDEHFSEAGNALVARIVHAHLLEQKLVPGSGRRAR